MNFVYMPVRGPLSGASFEAQTVAFFEALQTSFNTSLDAVNRILQAVRMSMAALQEQVNDNTARIATLAAGLALQTQRIDRNEKNIADLAAYAQTTRKILGDMDIRVASLEDGLATNSADIEDLKREASSLEGLTREQGQAIAALDLNMRQRIEEIADLQATTGVLLGREEPAGAICLCMDGELPASWLECNGNNDTPDLSGFVKAPLRFIRKRAAEENPSDAAESSEPENRAQTSARKTSENSGGSA